MKLCRILLVPFVSVCLACGETGETPSRVLVLGLDGMDPSTIDLLMSEGKMPNFARLRQGGAYGRLLSQEPLLSPIIWTTIATGKGPAEHGIGHFTATGAAGQEIPASSSLRRVKALWNIASEADKTVATVGWWATWPPEEVNGSVVSDHVAYHFLFEDGISGGAPGEAKTWPPALADRIAPELRRPTDLSAEELATFVDLAPDDPVIGDRAPGDQEKTFGFEDDLSHFRWALATAQSYRDIGLTLWNEDRPDLAMVYVEGTDSTSHLFGHLFRAEGLGGELLGQQKKFGRTVEEMYRFADQLLGAYIDAMDSRTTLVVLSDHGFELGALHDDPSKTRDMRRVSERFHRLEGILYLYGHQVKANVRIDQASILDIAPTVLALLGVPPATDMPGRVLNEAFSDPLGGVRVATWEGEGERTLVTADAGSDPVTQAQIEHLKSLGYLGGSPTQGSQPQAPPSASEIANSTRADSNLAAIHFRAGRYREAAKIYERLVDAAPDNAALRASLAGTLGALGRYDAALVELDRSIALEPLNAEAYHNRAVILQRQGEIAKAVADYQTAVRYSPQYTPSARALERLTGQSDVRAPTNEAEARASRLVHDASVAAKKANYPEAMRLLDEAQQAAPGYVLVYQYRSNVAYLMDDRETAITALEKALVLEPDNALFRANLAQLRKKGS